MFINIRVLRLRSTDWKSSLNIQERRKILSNYTAIRIWWGKKALFVLLYKSRKSGVYWCNFFETYRVAITMATSNICKLESDYTSQRKRCKAKVKLLSSTQRKITEYKYKRGSKRRMPIWRVFSRIWTTCVNQHESIWRTSARRHEEWLS